MGNDEYFLGKYAETLFHVKKSYMVIQKAQVKCSDKNYKKDWIPAGVYPVLDTGRE
jgi:hypothetical protein